jgi:hypothetical protein
MDIERRGFIGRAVAACTAAVAGLFGAKASAAVLMPVDNASTLANAAKARDVLAAEPEFIKTIGIGPDKTVTCYNQEDFEAWTQVAREVEACRILRELKLPMLACSRRLGNEWTAVVRPMAVQIQQNGDYSISGGIEVSGFDDPVDTILEAGRAAAEQSRKCGVMHAQDHKPGDNCGGCTRG